MGERLLVADKSVFASDDVPKNNMLVRKEKILTIRSWTPTFSA